MAFTTQVFLFVFFPLSMALVFLGRFLERYVVLFRKWRLGDWMLTGVSFAFYGWALFDGLYRFFLYIVVVYLAGRLIQHLQRYRLELPLIQAGKDSRIICGIPLSALALWGGSAFVLFLLFRFKYWNFALPLWNAVFQGRPMSRMVPRLVKQQK